MSWPTDTLAGIYLTLFAFGLIFSVVSLVLGVAHGHVHLPGTHHLGYLGHGGDAGHAGQPGYGPHVNHAGQGADGAQAGHGSDATAADHGASMAAPSPVNVSTAMIFLTWFGAAGYILRAYNGSAAALSFLVATVAGLVGGWLVYLFLARVLWRHQTELNPADYQVVGAVGRISSSVRSGGTGEVVYVLDGKQRVDGARSADGSALPLGAEVIITRYEGGLAYVESLASWAAQRGEAPDEPFIGQPIEPLDHPPPGQSAK